MRCRDDNYTLLYMKHCSFAYENQTAITKLKNPEECGNIPPDMRVFILVHNPKIVDVWTNIS